MNIPPRRASNGGILRLLQNLLRLLGRGSLGSSFVMPAAKNAVPSRAVPSDSKTIAPLSAGAAKLKLRPAFAAKRQPPSPDDFAAALEPAEGRRFQATRALLQRFDDVAEDVFFYGPQAGWGLRYLVEGAPLCALLVCGQKAFAVVAIPPGCRDHIDWSDVSDPTQAAKQEAEAKTHKPSDNIWIDLVLNAKGQSDLRVLVKARLAYRG